jgi:TatD DNase family protein
MGIRAAVVNGTSEEDWPAVAALAAAYSWVRPSFGLHPWRVAERSEEWQERLLRQLDAHPRAVIGEIGLDRWIEGHDLALQTDIFRSQLEIAAERNLPVAVHCLKAWGALWDAVRAGPLPACGFLLHSYGGPAEMVEGFARHGAYFSFSGYFLAERKEAQREVFREIPPDRLLVETDAPDMAPPAWRNLHPLGEDADGKAINHPANLEVAYAGLAEIRGLEVEVLGEQIEGNFSRLFGR